MTSTDNYTELCNKMMLPNSENLKEIWMRLCDERESRVAVLLPGTADEMAEKSGIDKKTVEAILIGLFKKGVVFKSQKEGSTNYKLAKNIIQLHDATIPWEGADEEFFELWKKTMDEDFSGMLRGLPEEVKLPSFMRVIPIHENIETKNEVLPFEECRKLIDNSTTLAVVNCPCRTSQKNCDSPVENCIQINRGAEYALDRGHGRAITKDEALDILRKAEDAGLVHLTENREYGNAICNCCECCCEMFRLAKSSAKEWILSPSRYRAAVDAEECTSCEACVEMCPVHAITMGDVAVIDEKLCIGCGLCASRCPADAITLFETWPKEHIPGR